jgi:ubiquinone/menaquinone biosynthesis C-methylase UbiE
MREPILSPEATRHYQQIDEARRLLSGSGQLELVRTRELLGRFLPAAPAEVIDVGGGAGIHAFWLADQGYDVHLVDAVPHHIETARETAQGRERVPVTIEVGDARDLPFDDGSADTVLLFGPLYHLTSREDRLQTLREASRVLRPGGVMLGAAIPRFASTINCLLEGAIDDADFRTVVDGDLRDGQHRNPTDDPKFFTTTFFHHPDELAEEVEAAGLKLEQLLAVEGPGKLLARFARHWPDDEKRQWLLETVRKVEAERHLFGVSTHIMAVAHR